jgi:hypothetical protein
MQIHPMANVRMGPRRRPLCLKANPMAYIPVPMWLFTRWIRVAKNLETSLRINEKKKGHGPKAFLAVKLAY